MKETTRVEVKISYPIEERLDAVMTTKVYKKLGFRIANFVPASADFEGFYLMAMECNEFEHFLFKGLDCGKCPPIKK